MTTKSNSPSIHVIKAPPPINGFQSGTWRVLVNGQTADVHASIHVRASVGGRKEILMHQFNKDARSK
jgi:hypothetical protein